MQALNKAWHVEANGGEWSILTADGDIVADSIPYGAYAEHIVMFHNNFLDLRTHVEQRTSP